MKIKFQERTEPPEAIELRPGIKIWADTDSDNRIINLVVEYKTGHQIFPVKNGKLCAALSKLKKCI